MISDLQAEIEPKAPSSESASDKIVGVMKQDKPTGRLIPITFNQTIPNRSWYRHGSWPEGQYKRFRHAHTMCSNTQGFQFFNEE
jgi:hypothetical protein